MDRFEDAKVRVKEATDLVALVESYLPLKPRGRVRLALCPFHAEKTPSFTVYPDTQHYHCYGCSRSGDVFTFLMEREGLTFREAMEVLAERAGIPLEGVFGHAAAPARKGPDPHQVLGEVRSFLQQTLHGPEGQEARDYLGSRGLADAIEPWSLGYHPRAPGRLPAFAAERRLPRSILEEAGLLRGGREPFAGRVIFPIEDERGRVVGFGGRVLPGAPPRGGDPDVKPPKYINSPESPFFNKRRVLFGLPQVKRAGARRIIVVEGYTDVIACHLAGFSGAVAALGTAFTGEHARKIERYAAEGVVLLFDGDRAGQQAAERAMRELVNSRLPVRIALLSEGKDPGEVLVARPGEDQELLTERRVRFADLVDGAEDALATWFRLLRRRLDFRQPAQFEAAGRECAALLALVDGELRRQAIVQEMARHLAVPAPALQRMLRGLSRGRPERSAPPAAAAAEGPAARDGTAGAPAAGAAGIPGPGTPAAGAADGAPPPGASSTRPSPGVAAEHELLACFLAEPPLAQGRHGEPFESAAVGELVQMLGDALALGRTTANEVVRYLFTRCAERPDLRAPLAAAVRRADAIGDPAAFFAALQRDRGRHRAGAAARELRQRLQQALAAGDRETADELTRQLVEQLRQERPRSTA